MRMKTIGIDARFYGQESRGLGRYTRMLLKHLEHQDKDNRYIVYLGKNNFREYRPENRNFIKKEIDIPWYSIKEQIIFPFIINQREIDLMHFPHFNLPVIYTGRFVVTIHDLILLEYPTEKATTLDPIRYAIKNIGYKAVLQKAITRSQRIITVSNFTKRDILRHFPLIEKKIKVIYEACELKSKPCGEHGDALKSDSGNSGNIKTKNEQIPYILYVGGAYPHKNLESLVRAFHLLKKTPQYERFYLYLVGGDDYFYKRVKDIVAREQISHVVFPGLVSESNLRKLYCEARLFVFPSFYEGFGLPPLEAMAHGVPVASSSAGSLPEILQDAACYFNPYDISDIAKAMDTVLSDRYLVETLKKKGMNRVKEFSWEKTAAETLAVYKSILGQ